MAQAPGNYPNSNSTAESILTAELASDVSAEGVLLAAVLLRAGSIEEAVANGTVTPAEVDEARQAIDESTLDLWQQRAELDRQ
jgi:hypothetical protein